MNGLVIDSFAGGGGASVGIEAALGRPVDIAINHDREALAMHAANHPATRHLCEDVWQVDPREACAGQPVDLAWFSPDCKHFSKAKGGKPVEKRIRGLAWVAVKWAKAVRPRVIILENVEEFAQWGPLLADGRPCPIRKGLTFRRFVGTLRNLGYAIDWQELIAADFGAPTSRKRLFLIARCDGLPIVWPEPTHDRWARGLPKWRAAAECIDWSVPCPSIFERARPLADATLRRIARGVMRYVVNAAEPFIVPVTHTTGGNATRPISEPLRTITTAKGGELALCAPTLINTRNGEREGQAPRVRDIRDVHPTITAQGSQGALVAAFLARHYGGHENDGASLADPMFTVTAKDHNALVASHLVKLRGTNVGQDVREPLQTISAQGTHFAEVRAFLIKFYGEGGQWSSPHDPLHTISTKDRMGLVTVRGEEYAIVDIGMRMLTPRELFLAQGFPRDYRIDVDFNGSPLTKTAQVRMCGNSVSPACAEACVARELRRCPRARGRMIPAYPLQWPDGWPRTASYRRKSAQFRGEDRKWGLSIVEGRKRVLQELERLRVTHDDVVVSTNLKLNLQGLPRGDQGEPGDPGVAVYWERNGKRRVMAIDHYNRVGDNLGAIAATLDAMRAIERHGGAQILERAFTGFTALPAPGASASWRDVLGLHSEAVVSSDMVNARYRRLAAECHPDRGGSHEEMSRINRAREEALRAVGA